MRCLQKYCRQCLLSGSILAVYCVQLSHAIACPFSKYFQVLHIFAHISQYFFLFQHFFVLFLKNCTHVLTFQNRSCLYFKVRRSTTEEYYNLQQKTKLKIMIKHFRKALALVYFSINSIIHKEYVKYGKTKTWPV